MHIIICSPTDLLSILKKKELELLGNDALGELTNAQDKDGNRLKIWVKLSMPEGKTLEFEAPEKDDESRWYDQEGFLQGRYEKFLLSYGKGETDATVKDIE